MHCEQLSFNCITSYLFWRRRFARSRGLFALTALVLGISLSSGAQAATTANAKSPLGMNLNGVTYYQSEHRRRVDDPFQFGLGYRRSAISEPGCRWISHNAHRQG